MMQDAFAEAAINRRHRVFGYALQPLSAAHVLFLQAIRSPVILGDRLSPVDLQTALKVCESRIELREGAYVPAMLPKPGVLDQWRLAKLSVSTFAFYRACQQWVAYWEDFCAVPEKYDTPGHQPKSLTAPAVFSLVIQACQFVDEARAWSMPFGLLRSYVDVWHECQGGEVRFAPDEEEEAEIEKQLAEAEEAGRRWLEERE